MGQGSKISLKQRRRQKFGRRVSLIFCLFLILLGVLSYLSGIQSMSIAEVQVEGNSLVEKTQLQNLVEGKLAGKYWYLFSKRNILLYPQYEIEQAALSQFLAIKEAHVTLAHFESLVLSVAERKTFGLYCGEEKTASTTENCSYLDENSYIFAGAPSFSNNVLPAFYVTVTSGGAVLGQNFLPNELFQKVVSFSTTLKTQGFIPEYIFKKDNSNLEFHLLGGSKIIIDPNADTEALSKNFAALLKDPAVNIQKVDGGLSVSYVDLRFGNKVFYK